MILTDTHTHFYYNDFLNNIETYISNAKKNHVTRFFLPNIDNSTYKPMLDLAKKYPKSFFPMAGIHPIAIKSDYLEQIETTNKNLKKHTFYAIGEIGIDLYHDTTFLNNQIQAFYSQLEFAHSYKLPVVIHCRNAFNYVIDILCDFNVKKKNIKGIFHCFSESLEKAQEIIDKTGFKLGIGGIVTFKNSDLSTTIESIPLSEIVLETDAPYLAPDPYRGKQNESKYIKIIAEKIAEIKNEPLEKIAEITTRNSKEIFNI